MLQINIKSKNLENSSDLFDQYMKAQINEIESYINRVPHDNDRNQLAILWIEEHAQQFRKNWQNK